jgi:lipid A ethanolaminephosphotransferase
MRLKLFRSTGYASVFGPGETRIATHPGWVMLATSLWLALVCNAPLGLALMEQAHPMDAMAFALLAGGTAAVMMGLLAWGNALKLMVLGLLVAGAWIATWSWLRGSALPWQLLVTVPVLALLPWAWLRGVPVKRLSGARQLRVHLVALLLGAACCAGAWWLMSPTT